MADEGRSRSRKALSMAVGLIVLASWIGGGVWYFGFDKNYDPCAHLAYGAQGDDGAAYDCAQAQEGR